MNLTYIWLLLGAVAGLVVVFIVTSVAGLPIQPASRAQSRTKLGTRAERLHLPHLQIAQGRALAERH
jgi:hypothetical protein